MADPPARNGSAAANGAGGGGGDGATAPAAAPTTAPTSPAASLSSATSRISFAIPSSAPQKAGIKPAPINLDARAGLPPKPVSASVSSGGGGAAAAVRTVPNGTPIAATAAPTPVVLGLPPKPHSLPPRPGPVNGERVGRMSSALPGPSDHRRPPRDRSREPGEVSPDRERERPPPPSRRRSRSRSRDRDWDRRDRREGDRYRRERSRSRERDYDRDRDRGSRDWRRDRDRPRDRDRDFRDRERDRDRDRDRDFRDRERDRAPRRDRLRPSLSPDKRYSDDDRPNGHGHGHGRSGHWHDSRDRDHDARRGSRYRDASRSPVKSPERRERSPLKRARSPDRRTPPRRSSPSPSTKRSSATPAAAPPPPPPVDDMPPPPPEPASAPPPPPPPKSSPPPQPHSRPSSILPSRPLSPRSSSAAPSAPRTLVGSSAATPQPEWKPPPSAFRRPGAGNYLVIPDPAGGKDLVKRFDGVFNGVEVRSRGDPRLKIPREVRERGNGYMKHRRDGVYAIHYEWDEHTPGPRPPPPPTAVLLTGLSPLTTVDQVSKFLRPYGRIKEIDAKMDVKSGMQLGIVWVKFDGPVAGRTGTAHEVAKTVVRMCDGQRIGLQGAEKVRVVLDGRGLLAEKAVKDEMARRHAPRPKPVVAPTPPVSTLTPRSEGKETPKPAPPRPAVRPPPPRAPKFESFGRNFSSLNRSLPVGRFGPGPGAAPLRAGFGVQDFSRDFHAPSPIDSRDSRRYPRGDFYSPADSRSRSRTPASSSDSDSDDDFRRRRGSPRLAARGPARAAIQKKEADEAAAERVKKALAANGHAYVFIEAKSLPPTHPEAHVRDHFRAFKPETVLSSQMGWYVLFSDDQSAHRAQRVLDKTAVQGHRVNIEVRTPKGEAAGVVEPEKGGWRMLTISKKRPRPVSPKKVRRRRSLTYSSSEEDERKPEVKVEASVVRDAPVDDEAGITVEPKTEVEIDLEPKKKRSAAKEVKPAPKAKKARLEEAAVTPAPVPKPPKAKPKKKTALDRLVAAETVVDDEDAFWLAQALAHPDVEDTLSDAEPDLDEDHPLFHMSGAWRAEGWKKVAATKKSAYLPQRNRATAGAAEAVNAMHGGTAVLATGRTARVEGRRLALDMESTRKAMAPSGPGGAAANAEASDVFAFNQLRIRKKRLRFARSAIEGYGLYAMESIQPGEMVCEYVGELCRAAVAEVREQRYMRQGIGSSYLFRVDGDIVCDATFRGSTSRLINHSCEANCNAKIISINGRSKIVLYAKRPISPGEELGYNYCFALESDPALRVPCLCGAPTCRGFLN